MFNSRNFGQWFEKSLLPQLQEPSIIIMDNAAYHKAPPDNAPNVRMMKKAELQEFLASKGIAFGVRESVISLRMKGKEWCQQNVRPFVSQLAEAHGHVVLFTPPYLSELQPIELLWADLKGAVGRQYSLDTTFAQVLVRLQEVVDKRAKDHESIDKMIKHVDKVIEDYRIMDDYENMRNDCLGPDNYISDDDSDYVDPDLSESDDSDTDSGAHVDNSDGFDSTVSNS